MHDLCSVFPQFSALYPEMVDALIFLDCYGFLSTDSVHNFSTLKKNVIVSFVPCFHVTYFYMVLYENVYYTVFDSNWKMFLFSFRKICLMWWGKGWMRLFALTKSLKRRLEFIPMKMQRRGFTENKCPISSFKGALKEQLCSENAFLFFQGVGWKPKYFRKIFT